MEAVLAEARWRRPPSGLAEFKVACGFDPLEAVKTRLDGPQGPRRRRKPDGAIVVHGPEKAKVMACVDKAKVEAAKKGTDITVDGDVFIVKDKTGQPSAFTFVNDNTLLGTIGTMRHQGRRHGRGQGHVGAQELADVRRDVQQDQHAATRCGC